MKAQMYGMQWVATVIMVQDIGVGDRCTGL